MVDNTTLNPMAGGDAVEDIDGANGTGGIKRQVVALGGIGKSGAHTALIAGQALAAASIPVVLNSDPDYRPASANITATDIASSSATGQDGLSLVTGAPTANSAQSWAINGRTTARVQVTGTWVATLAFEGSIDGGTTWFAQGARIAGQAFSRLSITGNGLFDVSTPGLTHLRLRATAYTSGTAVVQMAFANAPIVHPGATPVTGNRVFAVKGAINNGQTSYTAVGLNIGGLITVATGLPPGALIAALTLRIKGLQSDISAAPTLAATFFDANPSGSTYTDNATQVLVAADQAKAILMINAAVLSGLANGLVNYVFTGPRMAVDGSGNIYFAFCTTGSVMTLSGANKMFYELDGLF